MEAASAPVIRWNSPTSEPPSRMPKLSGSLGLRCRRARISVCNSSWVRAIQSAAARFDVDCQAGRAGGIKFHPRLDGDVDVIVLRLAQHRADRLSDAYDFIRAAVHVEFLADGIGAGKKFVGDVRTDQRDE